MTERWWTAYSFSIGPDRLETALSYLACVLRKPDIDDKAVGSEILSVDAEFQGIRSQDSYRLGHLNLFLCGPHSRCGKYFAGNFSSLTSVVNDRGCDLTARDPNFTKTCQDVHIKLLDWWRTQTRSCRITSAVIGAGKSRICLGLSLRSHLIF